MNTDSSSNKENMCSELNYVISQLSFKPEIVSFSNWLKQWFSTGGNFSPPGDIWQVSNTFLFVVSRVVLVASSGYRLSMLLNILHCTIWCSTTKNYPIKNVSMAGLGNTMLN